MEKIQSFTQLKAWQAARELAVNVYKATESFPKSEQLGLTAEIRRSSVAIAANIAAGFSRPTAKVKNYYYNLAHESLTETESHCYIAQDLGYLNSVKMYRLLNQLHEISKMINDLLNSAKERIANT